MPRQDEWAAEMSYLAEFCAPMKRLADALDSTNPPLPAAAIAGMVNWLRIAGETPESTLGPIRAYLLDDRILAGARSIRWYYDGMADRRRLSVILRHALENGTWETWKLRKLARALATGELD